LEREGKIYVSQVPWMAYINKKGRIPDPDVKIAKPIIAHDVDDW